MSLKSWISDRLAEKSTHAGIAALATTWSTVAVAAVMEQPLRIMIATAIPFTVAGIVAFLFKEPLPEAPSFPHTSQE